MISIIIPACNAERIIATTLDDYIRYFVKENQDFEIVVVANGCVDRTSEIIDECASRSPNVKLKHIISSTGKGRAVIEGFKNARGDVISIVDVDGSTSPEELHKLIKELGDDDGVIASRWLPGSRVIVKQTLARRIASRGFNLLVRLMFGLPFADTQCGAKAFKKRAIDEVVPSLKTSDFAFDIELLYRLSKNGCKVREIPTVWGEKGESTLNLKKVIPAMFLTVMILRMSLSPFTWILKNRFYTLPTKLR